MDKLEKIRAFLENMEHMVIATADQEGKPEAAFVGFAYAPDLTLIFGTNKSTRKISNILKNPKVAIVFGSDKGISLQYEGKAEILGGEELAKYKEIYFKKSPGAKKFENEEGQIFLKITPTWARYTDYTGDKDLIFEITF